MSELSGSKGGVKAGKPTAKPTAPSSRPVAAAPLMKVRAAPKQAADADLPVAVIAAATTPFQQTSVTQNVPVDPPAFVAVEPAAAPVIADAAVPVAPEPAAATLPEPVVIASGKPEPVALFKPLPVAAPKPTPAFTRGIFDMATSFDAANPIAAAQKVQAAIGGMNDRAKSAMEKSAKLGEELTELTKGNVEALVASGKIVAKGAESLTQEIVEYSKKNFESTTTLLKSMAAIKSPTELFQLQSEFAKSAFDSAVAEASKMSEAFVKLAGEVAQPISNRYAVAADKIKTTAL